MEDNKESIFGNNSNNSKGLNNIFDDLYGISKDLDLFNSKLNNNINSNLDYIEKELTKERTLQNQEKMIAEDSKNSSELKIEVKEKEKVLTPDSYIEKIQDLHLTDESKEVFKKIILYAYNFSLRKCKKIYTI